MITHLPGRITAIEIIKQPIPPRLAYMYLRPEWWRMAAKIRRDAAHETNVLKARERHHALAAEYIEIAKELENTALPGPSLRIV